METIENRLQVLQLHSEFDELQKKYGSNKLNSIYGAGMIDNPEICFIFMNPTGKNIASAKEWNGIRAQWLGTKNIWKLFYALELMDSSLFDKIQNMKPDEWTEELCMELYKDIAKHQIYITNLGKCTQEDARPLSNQVFRQYLSLLEQEISIINPKVIITFGNQVSSLFLGNAISVSQCRTKFYHKKINNVDYIVYPIYYPVGQGMRNINLAIKDIKYIIEKDKLFS